MTTGDVAIGYRNPIGRVEDVRKAMHEAIDLFTDEDLYGLGDGVITTRHKSLDKKHYVSVMLSFNRKYGKDE